MNTTTNPRPTFTTAPLATEDHLIEKYLTEWFCTCGRYGVFITAEERAAFTQCPATPKKD